MSFWKSAKEFGLDTWYRAWNAGLIPWKTLRAWATALLDTVDTLALRPIQDVSDVVARTSEWIRDNFRADPAATWRNSYKKYMLARPVWWVVASVWTWLKWVWDVADKALLKPITWLARTISNFAAKIRWVLLHPFSDEGWRSWNSPAHERLWDEWEEYDRLESYYNDQASKLKERKRISDAHNNYRKIKLDEYDMQATADLEYKKQRDDSKRTRREKEAEHNRQIAARRNNAATSIATSWSNNDTLDSANIDKQLKPMILSVNRIIDQVLQLPWVDIDSKSIVIDTKNPNQRIALASMVWTLKSVSWSRSRRWFAIWSLERSIRSAKDWAAVSLDVAFDVIDDIIHLIWNLQWKKKTSSDLPETIKSFKPAATTTAPSAPSTFDASPLATVVAWPIANHFTALENSSDIKTYKLDNPIKKRKQNLIEFASSYLTSNVPLSSKWIIKTHLLTIKNEVDSLKKSYENKCASASTVPDTSLNEFNGIINLIQTDIISKLL